MLPDSNKKLFSSQRILLLIILVVCFFSYYQITGYEFIRWDDDVQITENTYVKNLNTKSIDHNIFKERFTFLTLTAYSVIYEIWGNDPVPFHWLSLMIHLLNVVLVFQLAKLFLKNPYIIGIVALLFALHPMRVESVAWISELKDLLFTFFSLTAFLLYVSYLQNTQRLHFFILAAMMAVLASFSKIQGLLVPVSLFLFDILYKRRFSLALVLEKLLLLIFILFIFYWVIVVSGVVIILLRYYFIRKEYVLSRSVKKYLTIIIGLAGLFFLIYFFPIERADFWSKSTVIRNTFSFPERFLLAGFALWFYIRNFFAPFLLNAVHPYPQRLADGGIPYEYYLTLIVLVIAVAFSVLLIIKRRKIPDLVLFGWFFFLVNISIVMHFIPIEGRLVAADRYSYLAYFGLFISLASAGENYIFQKTRFKNSSLYIFIILICILAISTYNRTKVWKDTKTLFTDVLQKDNNISFANLNLAAVYLNEQKPDSALICFNQSIKLDSLDPAAYFNRAFAFISKREYDKALDDFNSVLRLSKSDSYKALTYTNIGDIFKKNGKDSLAIHYFDLAVIHDSTLAISFNNRGKYYLDKGMLKEARYDFLKSVKLNEDDFEALNNLGWVLALEGQTEDALKYLNHSIELNPDYSFAYNNRGYLKYSKRDNEGAVMDFNKAIALNPVLSQAYINRGRAYASMKNFKGAINDFSFVLRSEPRNITALTNRAYAWLYNNETGKAENDIKLCTEYYPQNAVTWQNLAIFHVQTKDYSKAINEFERSLEIDKGLIGSYINLGWIYMEIKDYKKADKFYKLSLEIDPKNSESLFLLGELNRKTGNNEASCKYYESAAALGNPMAKNALDQYCKE